MKYDYGLIFKDSRESAGLTQEQAAELLDRKPRTISAYECNGILPSVEMMLEMAKVYEDKLLLYKLADPRVAKIQRTLPSKGIINMLDIVNQISSIAPQLVTIARDDLIERDEMEIWNRGLDIGDDMIMTGLALKYIHTEKDKKIATI